MPSLCKHHVDTADAKRPKHHLDTSRKPPKHHLDTSRKPPKPPAKQLFHVTFGIHIGATEHMPSLCKHHLDTADAKRPKHHLDTSQNRPNRKPKNSFTSPLEQSKTATEHNLWSHRAHAQPVQTPCRHCRCKKTQTSSRHEPKTAQTANQKTLPRHL